jgi:23S rRNA (cytosine1962-C5)-methyltransferase
MKDWIDFALLRDFSAERTDAYRICNKAGGWAERFGPDVIVSYKAEDARDEILHQLAKWSLLGEQRLERVFGRYLPMQNAERHPPELLSGDREASLQRTVTENGVCYAIDFGAGYSAGLFLDQRANRQFVRRVAPRKLLNCFAYTCSFSVVGALAGAETLSIDLSTKSLNRGRDNFMLNRLATDGQRFLADDVMQVLPRLARKGERFDMIILDPPTFSRSRTGKAWQVEHDFERLLLTALELAEREAKILLATNCQKLNARTLEVMGRFCLKATRRAAMFQSPGPLPDFPAGTGASSVWMILR